jgi:cysteinyl-tRNA synthetase
MGNTLQLYNSLTRQKEDFEALNPPFVGMYVCGPTVYSDPHLGHARPFTVFDVLLRYLTYLGFKVRYVRNITDVGHLEDEVAGEGEDRIAKKARVEQLEPMEVVQNYTNTFHDAMRALNNTPPSIEPSASGHIIEQIAMIEKILDAGFAYEVNGSVYFDVMKYDKDNNYGILSGRVLEDLQSSERALDGQDEKRNGEDFALWKKAGPAHIMRWPSPWSEGFPGWHLECSAMGGKYLGVPFDIHGGGMDLKFPHHECEIAQSVAAYNESPVRYWMHNNMITIDGQKMARSLGNFIRLSEMFTGEHERLDQAYSPMTLRFFTLQTNYRSTLDFSNDALQAAEKGYKRLMNALKLVNGMTHPGGTANDEGVDKEVVELCESCTTHMNDDLNTAQLLAALFELSSKINSIAHDQLPVNAIGEETFALLQKTMNDFVSNILGLVDESSESASDISDDIMQVMIEMRKQARDNKDYDTSDLIRDKLAAINIQLKDGKDGQVTWERTED